MLTEATLRPTVDSWSARSSVPWSAAEVDEVVATLLELSRRHTPHVVQDVALDGERLQRFLLARTLGRLEDWLASAAAMLRRASDVEAPRHRAASRGLALGLRSATVAEIEALPGIGGVLATDIARYLANHPRVSMLDDLREIDGIGRSRFDQLRANAYLERATMGVASAALLDFMLSPRVETFLVLLERSDLSFFYGDLNAMLRRRADWGGSPWRRFRAFLDVVLSQATRSSSLVDGVLASDAERWLDRHRIREDLLAAVDRVGGGLLVNDQYVAAVKTLIERAAATLDLMVFLGTTAAGQDGAAGPLELVEAMVAAVGRGVAVRAILDQDDGGEPYKSVFINAPLVRYFKDHGVQVRFDRKDTLLHSKVLVADETAVVVGSHNWTRSGFQGTHELSVLLEGAEVARQFAIRFQGLWETLPDIA